MCQNFMWAPSGERLGTPGLQKSRGPSPVRLQCFQKVKNVVGPGLPQSEANNITAT